MYLVVKYFREDFFGHLRISADILWAIDSDYSR